MMTDPFLNLFVVLLPCLIALAVVGFFLRMILVVLSVAAAVKQFKRTFEDVARHAPSPGQLPSSAWQSEVNQVLMRWNHLSQIQQARSGIRQAEMMSLAAQARFPL